MHDLPFLGLFVKHAFKFQTQQTQNPIKLSNCTIATSNLHAQRQQYCNAHDLDHQDHQAAYASSREERQEKPGYEETTAPLPSPIPKQATMNPDVVGLVPDSTLCNRLLFYNGARTRTRSVLQPALYRPFWFFDRLRLRLQSTASAC